MGETFDKQMILDEVENLKDFKQFHRSDVDHLKSAQVQDYIRDLGLRAEPEACIIKLFQYIFEEVDLTHQIKAGGGNADFLVHTIDEGRFILEFKKYFEYDSKKRSFSPWHLNPFIHSYEMNKVREQVFDYLQDPNSSSDYLVLTNLQDWYFYSRANISSKRKLKPFTVKSLSEVYHYFSEGFTVRNLKRLELEEGKRDLGQEFFDDLTSWIEILRKVNFKEQVSSSTKLENIVFILNKFIFVRTLDAYGISPIDMLGSSWNNLNQLYPEREKEFLKEFFKIIDHHFHLYYDTELFTDDWYNRLFEYIQDDENNWIVFKNSLMEVLGVNSRDIGIRNYRFEHIDEDIFGGTYERFLAEQRNERKDKGIYYTPTYVTDYIVSKSLDPLLENLFKKVREEVSKENIDFDELSKLKELIFNVSVCDLACGSGSFLIQTIEQFWDYFLELEDYLNLLRENENKKITKTSNSTSMSFFIYKNIDKCTDLFLLNDKRQLLANIVLQVIHGVDLDARAIDVAKLNIWLKIISLSPDDFKYYKIPSTTQHILPNLKLNLFVGDSILSLPNESVIQFLERYKEDLVQLVSQRSSYITNYQHLTPDDILAKIEKLRVELDNEFELFLTGKSIDSENIQSLKPCYYPLFFWHNYFGTGKEKENGFQIVVGNPPYGNHRLDVIESIMGSNYVSYLDNYTVFLERALQLTKKNGKIGYIVPVSWQTGNKYTDFRYKFALQNKLEYVINLPFDVFKDAYVDTCLIISSNVQPTVEIDKFYVYEYGKKDKINIINERTMEYESICYTFVQNDSLMGVYMHPIFYNLPQILSKFKNLAEITRSTRGIEAYQYKISKTLPAEETKWKKYHEFSAASDENVYRYQIVLANPKYVDVENDIDRKSPDGYYYLDYFTGERLLIRRLISRSNEIMGTLVSDDFVVKKDLYCFKSMDGTYNLKFLLGIINSRLIHFLILGRSSTATKDDYRQITLEELRSIRIIPANSLVQNEIARLVDQIIGLNEKLKAANVSPRLEDYYNTATSYMTLRSYIDWPGKKAPSEKQILLKMDIKCVIDKIRVSVQDDWLTFYASGIELASDETGGIGKQRPITEKAIFRVKEPDERVREFLVYQIKTTKLANAKAKKLSEAILDLKIPEFYTSRKSNIEEIIKTVESFRSGSKLYQQLRRQIDEVDAELDARIFKLYGISSKNAELFLSKLDIDSDYTSLVTNKMTDMKSEVTP